MTSIQERQMRPPDFSKPLLNAKWKSPNLLLQEIWIIRQKRNIFVAIGLCLALHPLKQANMVSRTDLVSSTNLKAQKSMMQGICPDWFSVFGPERESDYNKDTIDLENIRKEFPTKSTYRGQWNLLGMTGFGKYQFPHGSVYKGGFTDGRFDRDGVTEYPKGQLFYARWHLGSLESWVYNYADGLKFDQSWRYCKYPDRRYNISIEEGLRAAGYELLTNSLVPRKIPKGCYDTGEGFYNPVKKCIQSTYDEHVILRIPTSEEEQWIIENCRKEADESIGYRPDLYPHWITGSKQSIANVLRERRSSKDGQVIQGMEQTSVMSNTTIQT